MNAPASARRLLLIAAYAVPASLLWDYSWESTVGVDDVFGPPHLLTYGAVLAAALAALGMISFGKSGVAIARLRAPAGAWLALWGAAVYATAFAFDRWWQSAYGLGAGIWHPPQIAKAAAFFAIAFGAWWSSPRHGAGAALALIATVSLAENFSNRQHGAFFYQLACGAYPLVLAAAALSGGGRLPATRAALLGMAVHLAAVWLLPIVPGEPVSGPVYHPRTHLLPPPFPPLLVVPALVIDLLLRGRPVGGWQTPTELGFAFFTTFAIVQWNLAEFLLSPAADNRFFAGGGKHWPFFLQIADGMAAKFWPATPLDTRNSAIALALAAASAQAGLWLGGWLTRIRR